MSPCVASQHPLEELIFSLWRVPNFIHFTPKKQLTVGMGRMVDGDFLLATFFFCFGGGGGRRWLLDTLKSLRKVREEIHMPKIDWSSAFGQA